MEESAYYARVQPLELGRVQDLCWALGGIANRGIPILQVAKLILREAAWCAQVHRARKW